LAIAHRIISTASFYYSFSYLTQTSKYRDNFVDEFDEGKIVALVS